MAGGFGTRLRPLTCHRPKPMIPLVNVPIMERVIDLLKIHGVKELVVLPYFQGEQIENYFGDGSAFGVNITYVRAEEDLGTAGSVKNAADALGGTTIIISGDLITDIDLGKAVAFHRRKGALATIVLTRVNNPLPYGIVITNRNGRILRFLEKPTWGEVFSDTINTGIYILESEVFKHIPPGVESDFSQDLFPQFLKRRSSLFGYIAEGYWRDVGNIGEYQQATRDILNGQVKIPFPGEKRDTEHGWAWIGQGTVVDPGATLKGAVVIGNNCRIEGEATLENTVIGDDCWIGPRASILRGILWDGVRVGDGVHMTDDIVAHGSTISSGTHILDGVTIGEGCVIGRDSRIKPQVKIWPSKVVEDGAVLSTSLVWGERWARELFFESKITGLANVEISPELAARLGAAFGAFIGVGNSVVTSRDGYLSSRMISRAVISGLMSTGVNVENLRTVPIPIVRYELRSGKEKAGLHVRSSPTDGSVKDIIFFDGTGRDLPVSKTKAIERLFFGEDFHRVPHHEIGHLNYPYRVLESYRQDFLEHLNRSAISQARLKVVVDYANGAAAMVLPTIFGELGIEVISLNAYHETERVHMTQENMETSILQLSTIVTSLKADAGFLIDPGAQRIFIVDETGKLLDHHDALLAVVSLHLQHQHPERISVPVSASMNVGILARKYGAQVIWTKDNHRGMMDGGSEAGVSFVGGTKGGFIFTEFQLGCDAMFATVKILELMVSTGLRFRELKRSLPKLNMVRETVPCPLEKKGQVMRRLMKATEKEERILLDGIRVHYGDSYVLILPGADQSSFLLQAEAKTKDKARRLVRSFVRQIEKYRE